MNSQDLNPEVVEAIRSGDQNTFAALAGRYRHELRVHCYRMLGSFTDADDLVQETLLKAWRRRETFEGRATFRAWLYRIATNACLDFLASPVNKREVSVATDSPSPFSEVTWLQPYPDQLLDLASEEGEPDAVLIARETIELAFLAVIQHLPPRQRAVLVLRDVMGWPAAEAAEALDLSVTSVKSSLQRARATLRGQLPRRRADWGPSTEPSREEREILRRYVEASQKADMAELTSLLREDARQTMPPASLVYEGRAAILDMWTPVMVGESAWGTWHSVMLDVNRLPAVANYVRMPDQDVYQAVNIDVLSVEDGRIVEITTFGPDLLPFVGLALTLDPAEIAE